MQLLTEPPTTCLPHLLLLSIDRSEAIRDYGASRILSLLLSHYIVVLIRTDYCLSHVVIDDGSEDIARLFVLGDALHPEFAEGFQEGSSISEAEAKGLLFVLNLVLGKLE